SSANVFFKCLYKARAVDILCIGYVQPRAKKMKIPDMHRSSNRTPHKQLKTIRERLGITQKTAAALLDVSYPYYLAIETGQREISRSLADKVRETFGVMRIDDKAAAPEIGLGKGERAPLT